MSPLILSRIDCRPHFTTCLVLMASSMLGMGLSRLFPSLSFLSIPSLVFAGCCYGLGVGSVPPVLQSSIFPQKYKSVGLVAAQVARSLVVFVQLKVGTVLEIFMSNFVIIKAFPFLLEYLGMSGIFFIPCVTSIIGALFAFLMIPETRNKSIHELEHVFQKKQDINKA